MAKNNERNRNGGEDRSMTNMTGGNAGEAAGTVGGTVAGAVVGSALGPLGTVAGAIAGGALGNKLVEDAGGTDNN